MTWRRIAIAGFQHETNTFAPTRAGMEEFQMADSWPGLLNGRGVIDGTRGMNVPIAGAVTAAEAAPNIEVVPILWCAAEPSGPVTDDAFDRISGAVLEGLRHAGPLDGIYLDLHGAMVTESHDDGEGALLWRLREAVGNDLPIAISLDLHANITPGMVAAANLITVYRTYPHLDMADTGARCMAVLIREIEGPRRFAAFRQAPFLVPTHAQGTGFEPCMTLYRSLEDLAAEDGDYLDLAMGFTAADIADCGPSVVAYAHSQARAEGLADAMMNRLRTSEADFDTSLMQPDEAVRAAKRLLGTGPVVIADVQDNPGAGASSDTTGLLHVLVAGQVPETLLGVMHDPEIAIRAHGAGIGATIEGPLGGRSRIPGDLPFEGRFQVLALSDGKIPYGGRMYGGGVAEIGPSCLLAVDDIRSNVRVVVSSVRTQCLDRALFTHFGADPEEAAIICVKSTVHFRADFERDSSAVLTALAPGLFPCQLEAASYRKLRMGVRLGPHGETFAGRAGSDTT